MVFGQIGRGWSFSGGQAYDNIFVERLWRTVKYEEGYLHDYQTVAQGVYGLCHYLVTRSEKGAS